MFGANFLVSENLAWETTGNTQCFPTFLVCIVCRPLHIAQQEMSAYEVLKIVQGVTLNSSLLESCRDDIITGATTVYECGILEAMKLASLAQKKYLASMAVLWARMTAGLGDAVSVDHHVHPGLRAALSKAKESEKVVADESSTASTGSKVRKTIPGKKKQAKQ